MAAVDFEAGKSREMESRPASGWKDILLGTYRSIEEDRVLAVAAGVTFFGLLAIFPATGALVSLYGLFADGSTISDHLDLLSSFLPGGATEVIGDQVKRVVAAGNGTLSLSFLSGLAIALWGANAGVNPTFSVFAKNYAAPLGSHVS